MTTNDRRLTHDHDGPLGVFLIGMRFNQWWRVDQWLPTLVAMPRMLRELQAAKAAVSRGDGADLGFLGARTLLGARGITVVQYWRSVEDIYRYAVAPDLVHRPAWSAFNARARKAAGAVGIWHETYAVPRGGHESVYVGCPPLGLATATAAVPASAAKPRARLAPTAEAADPAGTGEPSVTADDEEPMTRSR